MNKGALEYLKRILRIRLSGIGGRKEELKEFPCKRDWSGTGRVQFAERKKLIADRKKCKG